MLRKDTFELVVQVNGKVRERVEVATGLADDDLIEAATALPKIRGQLDGKELRRTVVVSGKLVNLVVA